MVDGFILVTAGRRCGKLSAQKRLEDLQRQPMEQSAQAVAEDLRALLAKGQPKLLLFPGHVRWMNFVASSIGHVLFRMAVTLNEPAGPKPLTKVIIEVSYPWDVLAAAGMYQLSRRWVFETMVCSAVGKVVSSSPKTRARLEREGKTHRDVAIVKWQIEE